MATRRAARQVWLRAGAERLRRLHRRSVSRRHVLSIGRAAFGASAERNIFFVLPRGVLARGAIAQHSLEPCVTFMTHCLFLDQCDVSKCSGGVPVDGAALSTGSVLGGAAEAVAAGTGAGALDAVGKTGVGGVSGAGRATAGGVSTGRGCGGVPLRFIVNSTVCTCLVQSCSCSTTTVLSASGKPGREARSVQ